MPFCASEREPGIYRKLQASASFGTDVGARVFIRDVANAYL